MDVKLIYLAKGPTGFCNFLFEKESEQPCDSETGSTNADKKL